MYSNNILNFQESTTILNACTKKSGNLLKAPHITIEINPKKNKRKKLKKKEMQVWNSWRKQLKYQKITICLEKVTKTKVIFSVILSLYCFDLFIGIMVWVFANGPEDQVKSYQRLKKWYLMPPYLKLSIIRYRSQVSGVIKGKELCPPKHLGEAAIEEGAFRLSSTMVSQLTYFTSISICFLLSREKFYKVISKTLKSIFLLFMIEFFKLFFKSW